MLFNYVNDRPLSQGVGEAALTGALIGATFGAAAPELAAGFGARAISGIATTAASGTGVGAGRVMLEMGKQGKHISTHNNFRPGRSIFTHSNPQALLDEFAGSGQRISGIAGGPGKERVNFGQVIGQVYDATGSLVNTTRGIIHYSNKGAHIVPTNP